MTSAITTRPAPDTTGVAPSGDDEHLMTLVMCDLVESTRLARLRSGDLKRVLTAFYAMCHERSEAHGGQLIRCVGDATLSLFHDADDPRHMVRSAIRMALALRNAVGRLCDPEGAALRSRIAIVTGHGLCNRLSLSPEFSQVSVFGEMPFLADRMKRIAPPGGIVTCARTARLAHLGLGLKCCGRVRLKGFPSAHPVWGIDRDRFRALADVATTVKL